MNIEISQLKKGTKYLLHGDKGYHLLFAGEVSETHNAGFNVYCRTAKFQKVAENSGMKEYLKIYGAECWISFYEAAPYDNTLFEASQILSEAPNQPLTI